MAEIREVKTITKRKGILHHQLKRVCAYVRVSTGHDAQLNSLENQEQYFKRLRDAFDWPLTISSGARCPPVNRDAGGVPDSCHLTGEAFDGYFAGHMNAGVMEDMADFAAARGVGVIRYPEELFCHFQIPLRNDCIMQ